jgi:hypothetical protein
MGGRKWERHFSHAAGSVPTRNGAAPPPIFEKTRGRGGLAIRLGPGHSGASDDLLTPPCTRKGFCCPRSRLRRPSVPLILSCKCHAERNRLPQGQRESKQLHVFGQSASRPQGTPVVVKQASPNRFGLSKPSWAARNGTVDPTSGNRRLGWLYQAERRSSRRPGAAALGELPRRLNRTTALLSSGSLHPCDISCVP